MDVAIICRANVHFAHDLIGIKQPVAKIAIKPVTKDASTSLKNLNGKYFILM